MTIYSVFEAPEIEGDDIVPVVVPEKFSWFAALLPPVYALVHCLWLGLLGYIGAVIVLALVGQVIGDDAVFWLYALLAVAIGFEAPALRRAKLLHRGWLHQADVIAPSKDLAALEALKLGKTS